MSEDTTTDSTDTVTIDVDRETATEVAEAFEEFADVIRSESRQNEAGDGSDDEDDTNDESAREWITVEDSTGKTVQMPRDDVRVACEAFISEWTCYATEAEGRARPASEDKYDNEELGDVAKRGRPVGTELDDFFDAYDGEDYVRLTDSVGDSVVAKTDALVIVFSDSETVTAYFDGYREDGCAPWSGSVRGFTPRDFGWHFCEIEPVSLIESDETDDADDGDEIDDERWIEVRGKKWDRETFRIYDREDVGYEMVTCNVCLVADEVGSDTHPWMTDPKENFVPDEMGAYGWWVHRSKLPDGIYEEYHEEWQPDDETDGIYGLTVEQQEAVTELLEEGYTVRIEDPSVLKVYLKEYGNSFIAPNEPYEVSRIHTYDTRDSVFAVEVVLLDKE